MAFASDCLDSIGVCPNRLWRVQANQGCQSEPMVQLIEPGSGEVIDLTQYGIVPNSSSSSSSSSSSGTATTWAGIPNTWDGVLKTGVEIVLKEMQSSQSYKSIRAVVKTLEDAATGVVYIPVDELAAQKAGVWLGMSLVWQDGIAKRSIPFYFDVLPNLAIWNPSGPLAMYEVRLAVRDTCPEFNFLIDTVEFKDEEIMWAMRRPIDYWNEIPPPIGIFSPITFPFRYHWVEATIGELLIMTAVWLRRNDLDYSAGGLTVEDTKKWPMYLEMGQKRLDSYKEFVKHKKIEINMDNGFASLGGYRSNPYR